MINEDSGSQSAKDWIDKNLSEKARVLMSVTLDNAMNTKRNYFGTFDVGMNEWFMGHILALTTGNTIDIDESDDSPFAIFLITRDYDKSDFISAL